MQQAGIAINGTFFNTHRMLAQYFGNAYFPQSPLADVEPVTADPAGKEMTLEEIAAEKASVLATV